LFQGGGTDREQHNAESNLGCDTRKTITADTRGLTSGGMIHTWEKKIISLPLSETKKAKEKRNAAQKVIHVSEMQGTQS